MGIRCCKGVFITTVAVVGLALPSASQNIPWRSPGNQSTNALFHHWSRLSSVVVGQSLWIHGGEITTWNGTGSGYSPDIAKGNVAYSSSFNTYSIDLSVSWSNESVELHPILSKAPAVTDGALWLDKSGTSFYQYDGGLAVTDSTQPPPNELWQFTPRGESGEWTNVRAPAASNFSTLARSYKGSYTSGNGLGFALAGLQTAKTSSAIVGNVGLDTPGLVMFNSSSSPGEWYNLSAAGYSNDGNANQGSLHFVPSYGPAGLLFVLGGVVGSSSTYPLSTYPDNGQIYMFDPISQQWASQKVTGDIPAPGLAPCLAGAEGDNHTYEIFMYGGLSEQNHTETISQGAVHVLSLPSFTWQKEEATPQYGRAFHSCNVIGNSQMISIGGKIYNSTELDAEENAHPLDASLADPWGQGIGIFDMSNMQWKDRYDPKAASYVTPSSIKDDIQENGQYPATWDNDLVKGWFTADAATTNPHIPIATSAPSSSGSKTNTGAIAGGVVGGVAGLALVGVLAFFLLKRQRPAVEPTSVPEEKHGEAELANDAKPFLSEMNGLDKASELP